MTITERLDLIAAQLAWEVERCEATGDREGAEMFAVLEAELDAIALDVVRVTRGPLDRRAAA